MGVKYKWWEAILFIGFPAMFGVYCGQWLYANVISEPPRNEIIIVDDGARHHASIPDSASEFEAILGQYRVRVEVLGETP